MYWLSPFFKFFAIMSEINKQQNQFESKTVKRGNLNMNNDVSTSNNEKVLFEKEYGYDEENSSDFNYQKFIPLFLQENKINSKPKWYQKLANIFTF